MRNFIFLMMVFVVFPYVGLIGLSAVHQFGGPLQDLHRSAHLLCFT